VVHSAPKIDLTVGFAVKVFGGFGIYKYGIMTRNGADAKLSKVWAKITKHYNGITYKIDAYCNTDPRGTKIVFGWST
jgi:hypothetical protein